MKIAVYTRMADPNSYTSYLGNSIHLAISSDGVHYQALNQNYGILFAKATISEEDTIQAKGVKNPFIFITGKGEYGITASRINIDGTKDEDSVGKVLLWTSKDLIHFSEEKLLESKDLKEILPISLNDEKTLWTNLTDICGAVPGNAIKLMDESIDDLLLQWVPLENISVQVPDTLTVSCREEVEKVCALAVYSDGSSVSKKVLWNTDTIDFSKTGTYEIEGRVTQNNYEFPLAVGYADPDVFKWEGSFYFIATNDNTDNKGFYVRKAASAKELFASDIEQHLILDVDPDRHLIQTFWAPEFHVINEELYILFAVGAKEWGPQAHIMKLKKGGDVLKADDWEDPIRVVKRDGTNLANGDSITLDMTYFTVDNIAYLAWSYRIYTMSPKDTGSMIFIATIDPKKPWILTSEPILLSRPLFGWENNNGTINNEGPYALITDENVYITFSGGAAGGYSYVLGLLTAKRGTDLLKTKNWFKSSAPVLSHYSLEGVYGPGHNAFFQDNDGNTMIAYHAQEKLTGSKRCTGIHRVHFDRKQIPRFDMSPERDLKDEYGKVCINIIVK
jgi:GH43 family beta-xylosidase